MLKSRSLGDLYTCIATGMQNDTNGGNLGAIKNGKLVMVVLISGCDLFILQIGPKGLQYRPSYNHVLMWYGLGIYSPKALYVPTNYLPSCHKYYSGLS